MVKIVKSLGNKSVVVFLRGGEVVCLRQTSVGVCVCPHGVPTVDCGACRGFQPTAEGGEAGSKNPWLLNRTAPRGAG
jgi:hypothetical protein